MRVDSQGKLEEKVTDSELREKMSLGSQGAYMKHEKNREIIQDYTIK